MVSYLSSLVLALHPELPATWTDSVTFALSTIVSSHTRSIFSVIAELNIFVMLRKKLESCSCDQYLLIRKYILNFSLARHVFSA